MLEPRKLLTGLIVVAGALFMLCALVERSEYFAKERNAMLTHSESAAGHAEGAEGAEGAESAEGAAGHAEGTEEWENHQDELVLGVNLQSPRFIALAAIASVLLALLAWFGATSRALLLALAAATLGYAVLDIGEAAHQLGESDGRLAVVAGMVAFLHLGASTVAISMRRTPAAPVPAPEPVFPARPFGPPRPRTAPQRSVLLHDRAARKTRGDFVADRFL
jgi:Flp pilus assembly protein TadB